MKKSLISLTNRQDTILRAISKGMEMSLSELVRRAVDHFIDSSLKEDTLTKYTWDPDAPDYLKTTPKQIFESLGRSTKIGAGKKEP